MGEFIPVFRFEKEDFEHETKSIKRPAILREIKWYRSIFNTTISPMELNQIEILVNECFSKSSLSLQLFTLKDSHIKFWLLMKRI